MEKRSIYYLIKELVMYGEKTGLVDVDDAVYTTNKLLELFNLQDNLEENVETVREVSEILDDMLEYAISENILESDSTTQKDLFDTKIMGLITPAPSTVRREFKSHYENSAKEATDYYYNLSKATNYIREDRIKKDEKWVTDTEFGKLDITINLSKPEKDPRDIAAAGKAKKSGYPACLLCKENEGYAGHISHPARQNHRIIPINLGGDDYFLQYSPYVYYNEHCIIFNSNHTPMTINKSTFEKLFDFVTIFPHYTAGSNADLPIVGGSILSHDHFQGGNYEFPMVRAPYKKEFVIPGFESVHAGIIKWPLSTIRIQGSNPDTLAEAADHILLNWRKYTDEDAFIFSETDGVPHNTITPIARRRGDLYELDLALRNNITTDENPLGVYHPHAEYHHIKKENIGLIEVMGLAILPARLKTEMSVLEDLILSNKDLTEDDRTASHAEWAYSILPNYDFSVDGKNITAPSDMSKEKLHEILQKEVGIVFSHVLENAGVYKETVEGEAAFDRFIASL